MIPALLEHGTKQVSNDNFDPTRNLWAQRIEVDSDFHCGITPAAHLQGAHCRAPSFV